MLEPQPSFARLTFSPDQLASSEYTSASADFIAGLEAEGVEAYLRKLHEEREAEAIHVAISHVAVIFEHCYRNNPTLIQMGEAFEDGALIATVIAGQYNPRVMPAAAHLIEDDVERYVNRYAVFSEQQKKFVEALREDGHEQLKKYSDLIEPIVKHVNGAKYQSPIMKAVIAEGASFVFDRVQTAQKDDYEDLETELKWVAFIAENADIRQEIFGNEVMRIIARENGEPIADVDFPDV